MRLPWRRGPQLLVAHDDAEDASSVASRLEVLDALVAAVARRSEVMEVIATARDAADARCGLVDLLGIGDVQASAVLDMQLRRFASLEVARLVETRDELLAEEGRGGA